MALQSNVNVKIPVVRTASDYVLKSSNKSKADEEVVSIPNCYVKVVSVIGTKSNCTATVISYSSDKSEEICQSVYDFTPNLDGSNFIKQAYEYLKTLPEFAGAADV